MATDTVQCLLCPHCCVIRVRERGVCGVRANLDGELVSLVYGRPVAVHVDPVEKKPLYHFMPGTATFSIATAGCNLGCRFCQNWEISQAAPEDVPPYDLPPEAAVEEALRSGCDSIAFTYTEPIVFYEYMLDTAKLAREAGLASIMVTAGYINEGPLRELAQWIDAANVDLKGMTDAYYREMCYGTLEPVQRTLRILQELGVWLEVTNLVVPGWNDDEEDLRSLSEWVAGELGEDVPVHFSRFMPMYQLTELPPTPARTLAGAREISLEAGSRYVYVGNVVVENGSLTRCHNCGADLIRRDLFEVTMSRISASGHCPDCGASIPGVWGTGGTEER
ncbi:AmmeMemoRadiSam system radical SAM enzyme [Candidatus Fermentibacterales bacterium]|nr:AmmeMemoRadiSam system radical SAM enzyme [Candidatus Fermentibacterales bacterium]